MQHHGTTLKFFGVLLIALFLSTGAPAWSQMGGGHMGGHQQGGDEKHHDKAPTDKTEMLTSHGGAVQTSGSLRFETVFTESQIRVYVMNSKGMAVSPRMVKGTVDMKPEEGKATKLELEWTQGTDDPVAANRNRPGAMVNDSLGYLYAIYDSRSVSDGSITAHVMLSNLPTKGDDKTAHWATPYALTPLFGMACPMHPGQASLTDGECSKCGGMAYQPATVMYSCSASGEEMRSTSSAMCKKCDMEMELKAVTPTDAPKPASAEPRHSGH